MKAKKNLFEVAKWGYVAVQMVFLDLVHLVFVAGEMFSFFGCFFRVF